MGPTKSLVALNQASENALLSGRNNAATTALSTNDGIPDGNRFVLDEISVLSYISNEDILRRETEITRISAIMRLDRASTLIVGSAIWPITQSPISWCNCQRSRTGRGRTLSRGELGSPVLLRRGSK